MSDTSNSSTTLSVDIRLLGNLLGSVIREQHGDDALALVEEVRAAAKARRKDDRGAAADLASMIARLDADARRVLIKAFSNYFQLINIADLIAITTRA